MITSQSQRRSVLNVHWKDRCWSWISNTLILEKTDVKNWLIRKDLDAGQDWSQEEKGMTENEMVGWHQWINGREFEQALGVSGQRSLASCSPWGCKEKNMTKRLNWNDGYQTGKVGGGIHLELGLTDMHYYI